MTTREKPKKAKASPTRSSRMPTRRARVVFLSRRRVGDRRAKRLEVSDDAFRSVTRWASIHEESSETTRAPVTSRGFRLAGVLERASAKDGGDKLGCSSFLDMARDSFDFYVMKTPIMRDVVLAAADLVFGNGIERTDFTDERYDRFAGAAVGWSEAVFRWAPSSGKTSTEWAELMSLGTRVMRSSFESRDRNGF